MANDGTVRIGTLLDDSGFKTGLSKLGGVAKTALKGSVTAIGAVATAAAGAVAGLLSLEEATEEYRIAQGKLNTAFEAAGYGAETAAEAYNGFYGILGDTDTATEASQLLAKLADSAEDVSTWTRIAAGVNGTFGDSLPIEGLIEASNETAKVGTVTGVLADALNWAGISEDQFNEKLAACTSESERNQLIMDTLATTYDDAADAFYRNNEALVASREAQAQMDAALAKLGQAVSNVKTNVTADFLPAISQITEGLAGMLTGTEGAEEQFSTGIQSLLTVLTSKLPEFLDFGVQIIMSLVNGLLSNLDAIVDAATQIVLQLAYQIIEMLPELAESALQIILQLANFLTQSLPELIPAVVEIVLEIVDVLLDNLDLLIDAAVELILALTDGLIEALPMLTEKAPEIIEKLAKALIDEGPRILLAAGQLIFKLSEGLLEGFVNILSYIGGWVYDYLIQPLVDEVSDFVEVGKNLVEGIWNGIEDSAKWIKDNIVGFGESILESAKSVFEIHSPSALFRREIGENIGLGVAKGIEDSEDDAVKAAKELAESVYDESKNWIDKQVKYQEYGLREQLEVWEQIRSQFVKESQQFADAEEQIYDIRYQIIQRNLDLEQEYQDALEQRANEIFKTYGLFDELPEREEVSGEKLLENLQNQVDNISDFYTKISELSQRAGISEGIVNEIRDMGPDAISELDALLALTDEKLSEYSALYAEKQALATQYATEELAEMRKETDAEVQKNLNALQGIYEEESPEIGVAFTQGVADGINDGKQTVINSAVAVAKEAVEAAKAVMAQIVPFASASVSATNSAMTPASSPKFTTESALAQAAGMIAMSNSTSSREIVLTLNGREMARGLIDNIRTVEKQTPSLQFN